MYSLKSISERRGEQVKNGKDTGKERGGKNRVEERRGEEKRGGKGEKYYVDGLFPTGGN